MKKLFLALVVLNINILSYAQNMEKEIDKIFNTWNNENHPGGVISISKGNETPFIKAYGTSNIKHGKQITEESIFNIGSVSKQFTAMGIVLLHLEGKLSLNDDIRKFIPQLFEFKNKITIRHLLNHTSGFRSTPELFGLAGWRDGDAISTDDNYRFFCKQTSLNFTPGAQFMYTNSGYVILARIIEIISGASYNTWMAEHIFKPLKLTNTFVDETNTNTAVKIATPYNGVETSIFTAAENTSLDIGASNIYTTVYDLSKWLKNFQSPTKGWERAFSLLQTNDTLNDGQLNNYAYGVFIDDFYGNKRIHHNGGIPGFLSFTAYYPDEELTIVLLTNFTSYEVNDKYIQLSQLFLKNKTQKTKNQTNLKPILLNLSAAKNLTGDYWNVIENYSRKIYLEQDTLWYLRTNGLKSQLIQIGNNQFIIGGIKAKVTVRFETGGENKMIVTDENSAAEVFERYDNIPLTMLEKEAYTGAFYSAELETTYSISLVNDELMGYHSRHGKFPITILKKDITNWADMAIVNYKRDETGEVIGFFLDMSRVKNVWFQKNTN